MRATMTEDEALKIVSEFREDYLRCRNPVRHANTHELLHALMMVSFLHLKTREAIVGICKGEETTAATTTAIEQGGVN